MEYSTNRQYYSPALKSTVHEKKGVIIMAGWTNKTTIAILVFILILLGVQFYITSGVSTSSTINETRLVPVAGIQTEQEVGTVFKIKYSIDAGDYSLPVNVVAIPGITRKDHLSIYLYFDPQNDFEFYKSTSPRALIIAGMLNILKSELKLRGLNGTVNLVSNSELSQTLKNDKNGILVIPCLAGYLQIKPPDLPQNGFLSWVNDGGILVLIGGTSWSMNLTTLVTTTTEMDLNPEQWKPGDSGNSGKASVELTRDSEPVLHYSYQNPAVTKGGAWLVQTFSNPVTIDNEMKNIQISIKATGLSNVRTFFIEIKDVNGNSNQYYIYPRMIKNLDSYMNIEIDLTNPTIHTQQVLDMSSISQIALCTVFLDETGETPFDIYVKSISFYQNISLIPLTSKDIVQATQPNIYSDALGLQYDIATQGVPIRVLETLSGKALGKITEEDDPRTSIASFNLGQGSLIIFGGPVNKPYGQEVISKDIMQIIQSGVLTSRYEPIYQTYLVNQNTTMTDDIAIPITGIDSVDILFYSTDKYHLFYRNYFFERETP
jgi:hypothetical protein